MQAIIDGLLTTYTRQGDGPCVLIVHGWADQSRNWQLFVDELAKGYDVIVPDLPGFGGTQAPPKAWGLDDYSKFISLFLAKIGAKPSVIIGHSNGGAIAIRGLSTGSLSTHKLVLLASAGIRSTDTARKTVLRFVTKAGKVATLPLPSSAKQRIRAKLYGAIGSDLLVAEGLQETFKKIVAQDVAADAAQLALPTLLVYGQDDTAAPVSYGQLFHEQIGGSTLEVIGGGHFMYRDQRQTVVRLVREFIA
jgi:pimeloyl-ACP methyl ester carboxylesterase